MIFEKVPLLRVGMFHQGVTYPGITVRAEHLDALVRHLEPLVSRARVWGYNQIPAKGQEGTLLRSHLSHRVTRIHRWTDSVWVDIEAVRETAPGFDLIKTFEHSPDVGAHLRCFGNLEILRSGDTSGAFRMIGIDVYPMREETQREWSRFIHENFPETEEVSA